MRSKIVRLVLVVAAVVASLGFSSPAQAGPDPCEYDRCGVREKVQEILRELP